MNIRAIRLNPAFFILALLAFCFGSGCKESPTDEQDSNGGGPVTPPGTPTVKIISPAPSAILHESITVEVEVQGIASVKSVQLFFDGETDPSMILVSRPYRYTRSMPEGADSIAWEIRAWAVSGDNKTYGSDPIGVRVFRLAAPTDLRVHAVYSGPLLVRAELTWTSHSSYAHFEIERSIDGQAYQTVRTVGPSVTGLVIDGPFDGGSHSFRISAVSDSGQRTAYCQSTDLLDTRPATDYSPPPAVGDSIVWDYHGGWVTSGASTEYYRGTKTWRISGQRTEQGVRILDVVQVFAGFKYAFPVARDTVWYPALVTAGQISEDSAGTIRITFSEPTGPAGTPALTFPRYLPDPGPFAEYTVGQYVGVRYTLQLRKDVGLIDVRYASGGGSGSFVCYMTRR